jgi:hypothetical protein
MAFLRRRSESAPMSPPPPPPPPPPAAIEVAGRGVGDRRWTRRWGGDACLVPLLLNAPAIRHSSGGPPGAGELGL